MKILHKISLLAIVLIVGNSMCQAQSNEFATPEGIMWGMSQKEVKKIKVDNPLSQQENMLMYYDYGDGISEIYAFKNDKLIKIQKQKTLYKKKDVTAFFDKKKQSFSELYGNNYKETTPDMLEWNYKESKISLLRMLSKKGGIIDIVYQPSN